MQPIYFVDFRGRIGNNLLCGRLLFGFQRSCAQCIKPVHSASEPVPRPSFSVCHQMGAGVGLVGHDHASDPTKLTCAKGDAFVGPVDRLQVELKRVKLFVADLPSYI